MAERDRLNATIKATIGGKDYKLRLSIGDIEAIEETLNIGLPSILGKLQSGEYQLRELRVVLERAFGSAGEEIPREDVREMLKRKPLPEALAAVIRVIMAGMDMGPTEAGGDGQKTE